ncbi:hypothetical protein Tco_0360033, partial [Tanacetum coccineum]
MAIKCSEYVHFASELYSRKQLDSNSKVSAFKLQEMDKSAELRPLLSVDSMLKSEDDDVLLFGDASGDFSDDVPEFSHMGFTYHGTYLPFWLRDINCDFYEQQLGLYNKPRATYVLAGSRNPPASVSAGSAFPADYATEDLVRLSKDKNMKQRYSLRSMVLIFQKILREHLRQADMVLLVILIPPGLAFSAAQSSLPSNLANSHILHLGLEDLYRHPSTGIFSSSSYDDDFGVQTRGTLKKSKFGESTFVSYLHDQQRNNYTDYLHCIANKEEMQQFIIRKYGKSLSLCPDGKIILGQKDSEKNKEIMPEEYILTEEVYVDDIIFGSTKKAWCDEFEVLMKGEFQMECYGQDKYVQDMLKKFDIESVRTATTPYEASKPKSKDEPDAAVNVHLHRSMIGSLMYLTASRPDIMFAVSAYSRHQVTPLTSNLNAVKKIFKDLKPTKIGCGSHGDRKSTTGGCQFLGRRLISWQCKKQTIVAILQLKQNMLQLLTVVVSVSSGDARVPTGSFTGSYCLTTSYWYALTHDPIIFDSLVKQFWSTASLRAPELGSPAILATIDRTPYTITEDTDQFGSPLAIALICLSDGRRFNWSSYIFKGMVNNISNAKRFLMYPRFLQIILGIATRNTKQYHVLKLSSKLFANTRLNFDGNHMPLLAAMLPPAQAAIADEGTGEVAPDVPQTIPETIQETRPKPDQSHEHLPTPPRPTTPERIPPVFEQGHTSDPNIASFSGAHESDPDLFTSINVEGETLGGSFYTTPPRSTQVPPVGPTSGGAEDLATLTALSSLVSELVQKVSLLESELTAHKLLFKDVVGKLVKNVKALELKLKPRSRKVVLSDSDQEDGGEPDVDLDALNALANAAVTVDSTKSPGGPSKNPAACSYDPSSDVPTTEVPSTEFPTDVPSDGAPTGPSTISPGSTTVPTSSSVPAAETIPAGSGTTPKIPSSPVKDARKGKGVDVKEPTPTHDKTFKQLEEEIL